MIVIVNDFEMKTTGCGPDPVSATSTSNSSHNTNDSSSLYKLRTNRNKPNCAWCRNHGITIPVKAHKRSCKNRDCVCAMCHVVREAGRYRALQLRIWREAEKERKLRETDRDMKSDKSRETATPFAPGTDSKAVSESGARPSLNGRYTAQNPSTSPAPNAIRNIIPPPQLQRQLTRQYYQDFESCTPLNAADTIVEGRRESLSSSNSTSGKTQPVVRSDLQNSSFSTIPLQQLSYWPQISNKTRPIVPHAWMTNHSVTVPPPQSIQCGESFTNSGPITTAAVLVADMCSIFSGSDSVSSSGSTSGRTLPIDPGTYTNIASSFIQPLQQYLPFSPACCFTNYAPQPQAATTMTDLLPMIDGRGSVSSSSTTNTTVPNVPNVCMDTRDGTDFHSIKSLSASSTSKVSRTQPVTPSAGTNDSSTSISTWQPVTRPSHESCETCQALAQRARLAMVL